MSGNERRHLASLAADLAVLREGEPAMSRLAHDALGFVGIEYPHSYRFEEVDGRLRATGVTGTNFDTAALQRAYDSVDPKPFIAYDPRLVAARERNRALLSSALMVSPSRLEAARALWRRVLPYASDQLRVLVCDGPAMVAWVGGYSTGTFHEHHCAQLQFLVPVLRRRVVHEGRLRDAGLVDAGLAAALEALPGPAWLVDSARRVVHRNRAASGQRFPDSGGEWTPIDAVGMRRHWLLRVPPPMVDGRLQRFARRYGLTGAEARVLQCVAAGRTNAAVAVALACSKRTVEVHLSRVLAKTDCESRSLLVARYWREARE